MIQSSIFSHFHSLSCQQEMDSGCLFWDPLLSIQQVWLLCNLWISLLICWKCYSTEMQVVKNLPWVSFYIEYLQKRQNFFSTTWNMPNVCFALFIFLHRKIIQQFPSTVSVFQILWQPIYLFHFRFSYINYVILIYTDVY